MTFVCFEDFSGLNQGQTSRSFPQSAWTSSQWPNGTWQWISH